MPYTFLQVGGHWINLDLVSRIELPTDARDPAVHDFAKIHFCHGGPPHVTTDPAEVRTVSEWLRYHRAV